MSDHNSIRINKYLSERGPYSRRGIDKLINERRILVNGKLIKPGFKVNTDDEIKIDGGISRSNFFSQFLADLINKKIKVAVNSEITSLGVAKLSLESSKVIKSNSNSYIDFNPNKNNLEIYNNKYEKWKKIILEKIKES